MLRPIELDVYGLPSKLVLANNMAGNLILGTCIMEESRISDVAKKTQKAIIAMTATNICNIAM